MAVVMMCSKDAEGARPWGVRDDIFVRTSYEGCVLTTRERNGYHDSDFYAVVWDQVQQEITCVEYASTRGWTVPNHAKIDATDEVQQKASEWLAKWALKQWDDENKVQAKVVTAGKHVRVVRGRKVPVGTEGWVGWIEEGRWGWTACMDTTDGERIWRISVRNLEVVNPELYLRSDEARERFAHRARKSKAWHMPFIAPGFIAM